MKVKELISTLQTYNPEEHIVVQWYSKEDSDHWYANEKKATLEQWEEVVKRCDNNDFRQFYCSNWGEDISEQLQEVMEEDDE